MKKTLILSSVISSLLFSNEAESFTLGEIEISDKKEIQSSKIELESDSFKMHNQDDIAQVLGGSSGVFLSQMGGRAESTISIRGFDARRVSVYIDGIPISVPYDGNFDYSRFLSSDISKITISKGFSSALYGANTMAGVINLISKKPTKEFEGDIRIGATFDNDGDFNSYITSLNLGTKSDKYYIQATGTLRDRDHFNLSNDFILNKNQPSKERLKSVYRDTKGSLKVGFTPNDESEYALIYLKQDAQKSQPPVTDTKYSKAKYWDWPYWDKESLYLITENRFSDFYLKTRVYKDIYQNSLVSYDDEKYQTIVKNSSFNSKYDDYSIGGSVEIGKNFTNNDIKLALIYKEDVHKGYNVNKKTTNYVLDENYEDSTFSVAIEDIYKINSNLNLVTGVSYDKLTPQKLYDTNQFLIQKGDSSDSYNPQIGLFYDIDKKQSISLSMAQKTHLPTMKERYSRRLGSAVANTNLEPEEAIHYELSYSNLLTNYLNFKTNLFIADISDAIESRYYATVDGVDLVQNQNIGDFRHSGFELELNHYSDNGENGANYTYIDIEDKNKNGVNRLGIPRQSMFLYTKQHIFDKFFVYVNLRYQTGVFSYNNNIYYKTKGFATVDTKLIYTPTSDIDMEFGIRNLFDKNYEYDAGFPEAGREFFTNLRYKF